MAEELVEPQVGGDENPFLNALKKFKAGDTPSKQVTSTVTSGVNPFSDEPIKKKIQGSSNGSNSSSSGSVPSQSIPTDGGLNDIPSLITGTVPNAPIIEPVTRQANTIATPQAQGSVADFQNTTQASLSTNPANRIPQENVVRKAQYPDPIIKNAQAAGQANNDIRNQNQTPQTERSLLEKVEQYAYLPAFNKGFNDLVVKPAAGATDFIDRTIDKAYSSITGEQTPEWLRKKGAFDKVYKYYEDEYEKRDKPTNIASDVAEGVVGTVPLM